MEEKIIFTVKRKLLLPDPQPEWCVTQGGDKWDGKLYCLKTDKPKT